MADENPKLPWRRYLSGAVANNPLWVDMADAISDVNAIHVLEPRRELQRIRNPDGLDRPYLIGNVRHLGFDYRSDTIPDEMYRLLMKMFALYLPENGTVTFVDFLGFIKNTRFDIERLWTKDYKNFAELYQVPDNDRISANNRGFYPTSHVRLYYDAEDYPINEYADVYPLFYKIAPIHLVLERVVGKIKSPPMEVPLASAGHLYQEVSGVADVTPKTRAVTNLTLAAAMSVVVEIDGEVDANRTSGKADRWGIFASGHVHIYSQSGVAE